MKEESL